MAKFKYTALAADGTEVRGTADGKTIAVIRTSLAKRHLHLAQAEEKKSAFRLELAKKKVPREEVMHFSRQLAAFIRAGIPILEAIQAIGEESENPRLREILRGVGQALREGQTFSGAVGAHPDVFPRFYIATLRSAELTGRLDSVLDQLSKYMERDLE